MERPPLALIARLRQPLEDFLDDAGKRNAMRCRLVDLEKTSQASHAGHAVCVPDSRCDRPDRVAAQQPFAATGGAAEERVENVVEGEDADRFAEFVDYS